MNDIQQTEDSEGDDIPTFDLDLDLPPLERWRHIATSFRGAMATLIEENSGLIDELDRAPSCLSSLVLRMLPCEQQNDVRALATLLKVPLRFLTNIQLVYELFSLTDLLNGTCGCTTAIKSCANGTVHARTLDWSWLHGLDALLVNLLVYRGGVLLYKSTSFVGMVGVLTGMRHGTDEGGGFTLSLNYRRPFDGIWQGAAVPSMNVPPLWRNTRLVRAVYEASRWGWLVPSMLREVLEGCGTFADARVALRGFRLVAPCFVALSGPQPKEGLIFSLDAGRSGQEQKLKHIGDVITVANLDPQGIDLPTPETVGGESPLALGGLGAKDIMMGESLLRRDIVLRLMGPDGDDDAVNKHSIEETVEDFRQLLDTVPIANEVTVHSTVMSSSNHIFISERSPGPYITQEKGLGGVVHASGDGGWMDISICRECCFYGCDRKSAGANKSIGGEKRAGSLLRRRGGGYFCRDHIPLRVQDLSTRS